MNDTTTSSVQGITELFQMASMDLANKENEGVPAWRRDPESSFSDWTIRVIQSTDENDDGETSDDEIITEKAPLPYKDPSDDNAVPNLPVTESRKTMEAASSWTYHVHRVFLASGPRKSEYFQALFSLDAMTEESRSRTTELVLPQSACQVFPRLLDYIYDGGGNLEHPNLYDHEVFASEDTTEESFGDQQERAYREEVALAFLADYLRVSKLVQQTRYRVSRALDDSNIHIVCEEALLYNIDWIVESCIRIAAQSPHDLLMSSSSPQHLSGEASTGSIRTIINNNNRSRSPSPTGRHRDSDVSACPPALLMMIMLPVEKQNELLKRSLSNALGELGRFKRVPSRWKNNIDDVSATHMPKFTIGKSRGNNNTNPNTNEDYRLPRQGCGLPFPQNKICPLFYFDREPPPPSPPSPPPLSP